MKNKNLIFVTGLPRTATTAVGQIISFAEDFSTIHEPFNIDSGMKEINHRFLVPGKSIPLNLFDSYITNIARLNFSLKNGIFEDDNLVKKIAKFFIGGRTFNSFLMAKFLNRNNIVVKDPFLCFCTQELIKKHKVIVTKRPLKNIAASYKRMKWSYMLEDFDRLTKALSFNADLVNYKINKYTDISNEVIAAIKIFCLFEPYYNGLKNNSNIFYLEQSELSQNPINTSKKLFDFLNLDFSHSVKNNIEKLQNSKSKKALPAKNIAHDMSYNKKYSNMYYNKYLDKEEIKLINEF